MALTQEFQEFDRSVRPSDENMERCKNAHIELREKLQQDENIKNYRIADFLQGSYARLTMVASGSSDVDVVVVTNMPHETFTADHVLAVFHPFLESHYKGQWKQQGRSFGVNHNGVDLDIVPTSAPSEQVQHELPNLVAQLESIFMMKALSHRAFAGDALDYEQVFGNSGSVVAEGPWAEEPLLIPCRHTKTWQETHPLATREFTRRKNKATNGLFLPIVRAIKWWRIDVSGGPKHPKSYPLEHMIGDHCPQGITSMEEGLAQTFESMLTAYEPYVAKGTVPALTPRGLEEGKNNVLSLVTPEDFAAFVEVLRLATRRASLAVVTDDREERAAMWFKILGSKFPVLPKPSSPSGLLTPTSGRFTPRESPPQRPVPTKFA
jgi:predicted nucleotidyltransferase